MCITSADGNEESIVWSILCDECRAKADAIYEERKLHSLFQIDLKEYGFCPECTSEINDTFERIIKILLSDEIP